MGGIYVDLLDLPTFERVFKDSLSQEQLKEITKKFNGNQSNAIEERHQQMLKNLSVTLKLQECCDIFLELFGYSDFESLSTVMKCYNANEKLRISDLSQPYLLEAANYLFKVSIMNVHQELKAIIDLAAEENEVLNKMSTFSK